MVEEMVDDYEIVWVIEEGSVGGAASALMEAISEAKGRRRTQGGNLPLVLSISVGDVPPGHDEIPNLKKEYGLDAHGIAQRVRNHFTGGD